MSSGILVKPAARDNNQPWAVCKSTVSVSYRDTTLESYALVDNAEQQEMQDDMTNAFGWIYTQGIGIKRLSRDTRESQHIINVQEFYVKQLLLRHKL